MSALERAALAATRALSGLGLIALMVLAVMTLADGLARWLAGQPIAGVRDVASLTIAVAIACCLPVGLAERANVTIRFAEQLGKGLSHVLDAAAALLVLVLMGFLARQFHIHAVTIARDGETTWVLRLPTAPFWYAVDVILWCAVMVQVIVALVELQRMVGYFASGRRP